MLLKCRQPCMLQGVTVAHRCICSDREACIGAVSPRLPAAAVEAGRIAHSSAHKSWPVRSLGAA